MQNNWPVLAYEQWKNTLATVHLWTQIAGKIRLRKMPWLNHSWHVTLYVSPWGLSTGSMPYADGVFQIDFNFVHHLLQISTSTGRRETMSLRSMAVADFYHALFAKMALLDIAASIYGVPSEMEDAVPFSKDRQHHTYDPRHMEAYWQAVVRVYNVFTRFRAGFSGKCSPVHFFWGAFDLAVTRFSGRDAPTHLGAMPNMPARVMQEAYSKEVSSCGFWPGNDQYPHAAFYAYAYPADPAFARQPVQPEGAFYSEEMGEFLLPYHVVQQSPRPEETLMAFLQSTYEAAANTGQWDREALECDLSPLEAAYGCYR